MILTVTPNPCVDKTLFVEALEPGAKIRGRKCDRIPGGKGVNVSRAVKALGGVTTALTVVAGTTGQHVVDMIEKQDGVACVPVWVEGITRTITTVLEEPIHRQTALFEPGPIITEEEQDALVAAFCALLPEAKVVTCNGAVPHPHLASLYARLLEAARDAGVKGILDSYGPGFAEALKVPPYMVKPNVEEAESLLGFPLDSMEVRWRAVEAFHDYGVALVVLSLGAEGALVSRDGQRLQVHAPRIEEVNPVGSGDALVAGFALGLANDEPLDVMARRAIAAGTANAQSWDIGHFTAADVATLAEAVKITVI
jgi:tagatose 6-phosphate kinase